MPIKSIHKIARDGLVCSPSWYKRQERRNVRYSIAPLLFIFSLLMFLDLLVGLNQSIFAMIFMTHLFVITPYLAIRHDSRRKAKRIWSDMNGWKSECTMCPNCVYQIKLEDADQDGNFTCPECGSKNNYFFTNEIWMQILAK